MVRRIGLLLLLLAAVHPDVGPGGQTRPVFSPRRDVGRRLSPSSVVWRWHAGNEAELAKRVIAAIK